MKEKGPTKEPVIINISQILREDKIAACNSKFLNTELCLAFYNMIGLGETGLYTELNKNWWKIEEAIDIYIDCLKDEILFGEP